MNQGEVVVIIKADGKKLTAGLKSAESDVNEFTRNVDDQATKAEGRFDKLGRATKVALKAMGIAAAAAGVASIKMAADFEQSLNILQSVTGATSEQMAQLQARARQLGNDLTLPGVSAGDAALAMTELAKAGLSVNDTLTASKGVLSLAKAGQLDTADAAEIAANALNAFSLKGSEANRVADLLAAAANASSAGVSDLAQGMQMSSASAAAMKVPVEDLVTLLAAMSNNGIKGSDAGTSLKTMLMRLIPTTEDAAEAMADLGLDFFNAKGEFVGMRSVVEKLQTATKGMTDEQRNMTLQTIFGADAVRAANVLIKEGVKGYDGLSKAVNTQGAAAALAAAQNKGLKGALDGFKSTLETIGTDIGMVVIPTLTKALNGLSSEIPNLFNKMVKLGQMIGDYLSPKLAALWATIQDKVAPALVRLWKEVIQPLLPIIGTLLVFALGLAIDAFNLLLLAVTPVINFLANNKYIITLVAAAFVALKAAMLFNSVTSALLANLVSIRASLLTTKTVLAGLRTLAAKPIILAIAIGAALAAIQYVWDEYNKMKAAIEDARQSAESRHSSDMKALQYAKKQLDSGKWNREQYNRIVKSISSRATGGPVSAGKPYFVGDNPDGSLNSTSELFIPKTSGTIVNNSDLMKVLAGSNKQPAQIQQTNYIQSPMDLDVVNRSLARAINR